MEGEQERAKGLPNNIQARVVWSRPGHLDLMCAVFQTRILSRTRLSHLKSEKHEFECNLGDLEKGPKTTPLTFHGLGIQIWNLGEHHLLPGSAEVTLMLLRHVTNLLPTYSLVVLRELWEIPHGLKGYLSPWWAWLSG